MVQSSTFWLFWCLMEWSKPITGSPDLTGHLLLCLQCLKRLISVYQVSNFLLSSKFYSCALAILKQLWEIIHAFAKGCEEISHLCPWPAPLQSSIEITELQEHTTPAHDKTEHRIVSKNVFQINSLRKERRKKTCNNFEDMELMFFHRTIHYSYVNSDWKAQIEQKRFILLK